MIKRCVDEDIEPVPFHARLRPAKTVATARRISRTVVPRGFDRGIGNADAHETAVALALQGAAPICWACRYVPFFLLIGPF